MGFVPPGPPFPYWPYLSRTEELYAELRRLDEILAVELGEPWRRQQVWFPEPMLMGLAYWERR